MPQTPNISVAFALVNSPAIESTTQESQQMSTIPSEIEAIVEDFETFEFKLREEMEKVRTLIAEKEELLEQLIKQMELIENQVKAIQNLQEERNHFLMLLMGVCAGLFFIIFGYS